MVMVALMNPSSMLHHVIAGAFLLILFPSNLSAAPVQQNMISLYNQNDKVVILVGKNFSSTVYQSATAWLVEFYASWCGHCQHYAKVIFSRSIHLVSTVLSCSLTSSDLSRDWHRHLGYVSKVVLIDRFHENSI